MNVALFGFMATGKTTVGRILAKRIGYEFIDIDSEVEKAAGASVSEIFRLKGESNFRVKEKEIISSICHLERRVIACGGGAVLDPDNVSALSGTSRMILLNASVSSILSRTRDDESRPLLNTTDRNSSITSLMANRMPSYLGVADFIVDTDCRTPEDIVDEIVAKLGGRMI